MRLTGLAALLLALPGLVAAKQSVHVPRPGFVCNVGQAWSNGAWASATVDINGRLLNASWEWRRSADPVLLRIGAFGRADGPVLPTGVDGVGSVQWARPQPLGRHQPMVRLELSANEPRSWPPAVFAGEFTRNGDHSLHARWADLLALARGAERLTVVLRDKNGIVAATAPVEPALVVAGGRQIAARLTELRGAIGDFRRRCQPTDDVDPQIVVT